MAEHLVGNLYQVGGETLTHELDGASYLVLDEHNPNDSALIDCGSPLGFAELTDQLRQFDISIDDVLHIHATHGHYDHVAAASLMRRAMLHIHEGDHYAVETGDGDLTASFLYNKHFPPIKSVVIQQDGDTSIIDGTVIRAIHTPGHTPGSMSYKVITNQGYRVLITGDTLWGGYEQRIHSDADLWKNSLEKLSLDGFDAVTFGHGIRHLVPDAMAHLALARSRFMKAPRRSHEGQYIDPWHPLQQ